MFKLDQRLTELPQAPQSVVKAVSPEDWGKYWDMASIGMPQQQAFALTFDAQGQLVDQKPQPVADVLKAASGQGWLVQDANSAGLYLHGSTQDYLLVASNAAYCASEDCHCG